MSSEKNIQVTLLNDRPLIFKKVRHHSRSELYISLLTNALGWAIWLYFWKVLLTSIAWYFGLRLAYDEWVIYGGWKALVLFLEFTAPYGLALCLVLWVWAIQDIWRFQKDIRRRDVRYPSIQADLLWTTISRQDLEKARTEKILKCAHDANGELSYVAPHN